MKNIREFSKLDNHIKLSQNQISKINQALYCLKEKSKNICDIIEKAHFLIASRPILIEGRAEDVLKSGGVKLLLQLTPYLETVTWYARKGLKLL